MRLSDVTPWIIIRLDILSAIGTGDDMMEEESVDNASSTLEFPAIQCAQANTSWHCIALGIHT